MGMTDKNRRRGGSAQESSVTIVTPGCHFSGKLVCRGSSRIGGKIEGEIISEGMLIIEEDAFVTAEIQADNAVIHGIVDGKIRASGRVELAASCRFSGDISSPALIIHEGAQFNGKSSMVDPTAEQTEITTPKLESILKSKAVANAPEVNIPN